MEQTTIIWRFTDGKQGHENQTSGLVAALGCKRVIKVFDVPVSSLPSTPRLMFQALLRRKIQAFPSEKPDLIIGAGRSTHIPMVIAKIQNGGKSVVLMRPSVPHTLFDLIVAPKHDNVPFQKNLIETNGVLNSVQFVGEKNLHSGLILIGGESSHYEWNEKDLVQQIEQITEHDQNVDWTLTTSRRTPASFLQLIQNIPVEVVPIDKTDNNWMQEQFATRGQIWVTPDSVSMVYEALSSGGTTRVFHLEPSTGTSRVRSGLDSLIKDKIVVPFDAWKQEPNLQHQSVFFNESTRVADYILEHLL